MKKLSLIILLIFVTNCKENKNISENKSLDNSSLNKIEIDRNNQLTLPQKLTIYSSEILEVNEKNIRFKEWTTRVHTKKLYWRIIYKNNSYVFGYKQNDIKNLKINNAELEDIDMFKFKGSAHLLSNLIQKFEKNLKK